MSLGAYWCHFNGAQCPKVGPRTRIARWGCGSELALVLCLTLETGITLWLQEWHRI